MESLLLTPLHHGFYDGVGGSLRRNPVVSVGVQGAGELARDAVVRRAGASTSASWGRHGLNPLQDRKIVQM